MSDSSIQDWMDRVTRETPSLSERGRARRDAMRRELEGAVGRRRRTRTGLRVGIVALLVAIGGILGWRGTGGETEPAVRPLELAVVRDDPGVLDRYAVRTRAIRPDVLMTDDEMLDLLVSIERPAGLVRAGGETWLTAVVTDELE